MIVSEHDAIDLIDSAKSVFLLEPPYKSKYIPIGLMKIASRVKQNGGTVYYGRHYCGEPVDLICVTTLFTYEARKTIDAINRAKFFFHGPILAGGIYASLMPQHLIDATECMVYQGYSKELDSCVPDYSPMFLEGDRFSDFSITFTTRGCPNHCGYCAVPRIEPQRWINPMWKQAIIEQQRKVMISDNNLTSFEGHCEEVLQHLGDLQKPVLFNNGIDVKYIDTEKARLIGGIKFIQSGLKIAFDRIEEDGIFQEAVGMLFSSGVKKQAICAFVLFNFNDTPEDANYRMKECNRLGIRPYPQLFSKLNMTSRKSPYVGKHWTRQLAAKFRYFWLLAGLNTKQDFFDWYKAGNFSSNGVNCDNADD